TDRAVGTDRPRFLGLRESEWPDRCCVCGFALTEAERTECRPSQTRAGANHELAPRELHVHQVIPPRNVGPLRGTLALASALRPAPRIDGIRDAQRLFCRES